MRHDDSLATILLVSRLCAEGVQPLKASEYWGLLDQIAVIAEAEGGAPGAGQAQTERRRAGPGLLLEQGADAIGWRRGLAEDLAGRIGALTDRATALAFELDRLERSGIKALTALDEHYPRQWLARLRATAPPLVFGAGALELLDNPGLAVVGSRDVSQQGGEVAKEVARLAARRGLALVSGGARGVDQLAMDAAHKAGGPVAGILAESLSRKVKRPDVRRAIHDGATVLCTPYSPHAPFSAANAMGRNKLIYAQAALTVVVASDAGSGGTWSGATTALARGYGPVAVWRGDGEGPGNEPLQHRGALPVSSLNDIETLLEAPHAPLPASDNVASPKQQSLFAETITA